MDERLRFVVRLLEGEKMAPLCAEFGIPSSTRFGKKRAPERRRSAGICRNRHNLSPTAL